MPRIAHGSYSILSEEAPLLAVEEGNNNPAIASHPAAVAAVAVASATAAPAASAKPHFTYLFVDLIEKPENLLPDVTQAPTILKDLTDLGISMLDEKHEPSGNSTIPAAYTYFGQFLDHDITFTDVKKPKGFTDAKVLGDDTHLSLWPLERIYNQITNKRRGILELDSVYGLMPPEQEWAATCAPPRSESNPEMMALKFATITGGLPPGKSRDEPYDLPRREKSACPKRDRAALIADPRNDSNLIVSQLHVAFLRAHNELVKRGNSFDLARRTLRDCYHWLIVHDFLMKIADPTVVKQVLASNQPLYNPPNGGSVSLPLEFTAAAYRFGHSMVRNDYYLSDSAQFVLFGGLFMPIVLGRGFGPNPGKGTDTLAEDMIVQWESFLPGTDNRNKARQINTRMVEPLFSLLDETAKGVKGEHRLAVQDLKRGYMWRLPTGQAMAERLEIPKPITSEEIKKEVSLAQLDVLTRKGTELLERTPLWFYILAEAKIQGQGNHLGQVGSRLVAEVLIGLIRRIPDSFLNTGWKPGSLGFKKDDFTLSDLMRLAKVVPENF